MKEVYFLPKSTEKSGAKKNVMIIVKPEPAINGSHIWSPSGYSLVFVGVERYLLEFFSEVDNFFLSYVPFVMPPAFSLLSPLPTVSAIRLHSHSALSFIYSLMLGVPHHPQ